MSFIGRAGFFGPLPTFNGRYHDSVYAQYSRGGGYDGGGVKRGRAFAYTRPKFDDGGSDADAA